MSSRSTSDTAGKKLSVRELAELSLLAALMFAGKEALSGIPNVHPVALLILVCTAVYGWKALYSVAVFVLLEIAVYGVGMWTLMYAYVWPLLAALSMLLRKDGTRLMYALLAAFHGLAFGALTSIPYVFIVGFKAELAWWAAGVPYDLIHCVSNFVIVLLLFEPLRKLVQRLHDHSK